MLEMYAEGKTLQQIGDVFSISRERVRQILEYSHPVEYHLEKKKRKEEAEDRKEEKYIAKLVNMKCRVCGADFSTTDHRRRYCTSECRGLWFTFFRKIVEHDKLRIYQGLGLEQNRYYLHQPTLDWAMYAYDNNWPVFDEFPKEYQEYTLRRYYD